MNLSYNIEKKPLPKVSIIMPVFNNKEDINNAIDSIIAQTMKEWELIIIDDCSTDGTNDQIFQYLMAKKDYSQKIKLITNLTNKGTYISLNIGLLNSSGKYICRLDSDDYIDPNMLEKQSCILDNDKSENFIASQSLVKKPDGRLVHGEITLMYRKSIIEKIGYYDSIRYGADTEFMLRIWKTYGHEKIYKLYDPLYTYKSRNNSLTTSSVTGLLSKTSGRRQYLEAFKKWHNQNQSVYMPYPLINRPFPIDKKMVP